MTMLRFLSQRVALLAALLLSFVGVTQAFEAQSTWGGTASGSANALSIGINNVSSLNDILGVPIRFIPAADNTGPTTLVVGGMPATALKRPSSIGLVDLSGAELKAGEPTCVVYSGSVYVLSCNVDMTPIGRTVEFRGSVTPRGTLIEDGSCVSRTTYAALFTVIGTNYGAGDGTTTFCLPDSRGRAFAALDTQGAFGAAGRITSAGSGCNATVVGSCGQENNTLLTTHLPPYTPGGSVAGSISGSTSGPVSITDPGHTHQAANVFSNGGSSNNQFVPGPSDVFVAVRTTTSSTTGITASYSGSVSGTFSGSLSGTAQGGASTPFTNLPPISLGRRAIKY